MDGRVTRTVTHNQFFTPLLIIFKGNVVCLDMEVYLVFSSPYFFKRFI